MSSSAQWSAAPALADIFAKKTPGASCSQRAETGGSESLEYAVKFLLLLRWAEKLK